MIGPLLNPIARSVAISRRRASTEAYKLFQRAEDRAARHHRADEIGHEVEQRAQLAEVVAGRFQATCVRDTERRPTDREVSASLNFCIEPIDSSCTLVELIGIAVEGRHHRIGIRAHHAVANRVVAGKHTDDRPFGVPAASTYRRCFMFLYMRRIGSETVTSCRAGRYCRPSMIFTFD